MKKNYFKLKFVVVLILCVFALSVVFTSCSKEEYFDNQTWVGESFKTEGGDLKWDITLTFFGNQVNAKIKLKDSYYGDSESFTAKGKYTYDKQKVRMTVENDNYGVDDTWSGKVDKKTMTLNVVIENWEVDEQVRFTKQ